MRTFWLKGSLSRKGTSVGSSIEHSDEMEDTPVDQTQIEVVNSSNKANRLSSGKISRLVDWNVDVLSRLLRQVVARRNAINQMSSDSSVAPSPPSLNNDPNSTSTVLEEVREIIELPRFDPNVARVQQDPETIELDETVVAELREYVANVAAMYHDNPFHNFEHASHVTMSVSYPFTTDWLCGCRHLTPTSLSFYRSPSCCRA